MISLDLAPPPVTPALPGVMVRRLTPHRDERGAFTELFRDEWGLGVQPGSWELAHIDAGASRPMGDGVFVVLDGRLRLDSGGRSLTVEADAPTAVVVAPAALVLASAQGERVMLAYGRPRLAPAVVVDRRAGAQPALPSGVELIDLPTDRERTVLYDRSWGLGVEPVQWNAVRSRAGVLRGVHCHAQHADLLFMAEGRMRLGLADLRGGRRDVHCLDLTASLPQLITIPPGVAHGFLFLEPSLHVYAVDRTWDTADELGCRWDDPALAMPWGQDPAALSARDAELGSLDALVLAMGFQTGAARL